METLAQITLPSALTGMIAILSYPLIALIVTRVLGPTDQAYYVLSQDAAQFIQDILIAMGEPYVIIVGFTYYFSYQQQEQIFLALFDEVSQAQSLLEQISLSSAGRSMYPTILQNMQSYVRNDLLLSCITNPDPSYRLISPAAILSRRPSDDPLEGVLYLTSVGIPGHVYKTVKALRRARARRLGALQRKLPALHLQVLRLLIFIIATVFWVCGSGSERIAGGGILTVQCIYFGILVFAMSLILGVIEELWRGDRFSAYSVDGVLGVMVRGLESELDARLAAAMEWKDVVESQDVEQVDKIAHRKKWRWKFWKKKIK